MKFKNTSLAILVTLFIIYVSSIPDSTFLGSGTSVERIISNLLHIPAFALLTFLWLNSFSRIKYGKRPIIIVVTILAGLILFAISDEIRQSFVPGRTASPMDLGLDLLGITFGLVAFRIMGTGRISQKK